MNTDIRLSTTFFSHRKTKKLRRALGDHGVLCLVNLWTRVALDKPCGHLVGWLDDDIEIEAGFEGDPGVFVRTIVDVGFLDKGECYSLHNWETRQSWVVNSQERSDKARLIRMAKTHNDIYKRLVDAGYTGVTREQYNELTKIQRPVNATLTPAPAPAPDPDPAHNDKEFPPAVEVFVRSFCGDLSRNGGKQKYTKKEIANGADTIEKLVRLDKYDLEKEIRPALQWGLKDSFWSGQIRSLAQLRKKSNKNGESKFTNLFNQFSARDVGCADHGARGQPPKQNMTPRQQYMNEIGSTLTALKEMPNGNIDTGGRENGTTQISSPLS